MFPEVFVLDNGTYSIKAGYGKDLQPKCIPNFIMKVQSEKRRVYVGDQIDSCYDRSGLYYVSPFTKGLLSDWGTQKTIWDYLFSDECCRANMPSSRVIFTQPYNNFAAILETVAEIFFEEYNCKSLLVVSPGDLSAFHYSCPPMSITRNTASIRKYCVVVDSGHSSTTIAPYIDGEKYTNAIKRIDVGGKILTNYLKDLLSYRQLNVMQETYVINQVKEDCCFVSQNIGSDMLNAQQSIPRNKIALDYALPDFSRFNRGFVMDGNSPFVNDSQKIRLNTERFAVPEILFHPSDAGIDRMGLAEAITHCISMCPSNIQKILYENILLTGGSALFPGFQKRLYTDLKTLLPTKTNVRIAKPENPITYAWEGGAMFGVNPLLPKLFVSKAEYAEHGMNLCRSRFNFLS